MSGHDNLSNLPASGYQMVHQGFSADKEKLDTSSAARGDLSLGEAVSTSMDELLLMKDDVLKALLTTESEIDLLENELKCISSESGPVVASSISSSFELKDYARPGTGQDDVASVIPKPASLPIVSSGDTGVGKICYVKGTDPDCHDRGTFNMLEKDNRLVNVGAVQSAVTEMVKAACGSSEEEIVQPFKHVKFPGDAESKLCELILSNRECANRASSKVFNNLFLKDHNKLDVAKVGILYPLQDNSRTRENFCQRKRSLIFKERVLALKFKGFHHLWQKDMCILSPSGRLKSWKKLESSLQIKPGRCQKPRSSIRARVFSPGKRWT